jgi:putative transcriptional regulator
MVRRWILLLFLAALPALPQSGDSPDDLGPGRFLVADRKLTDPNFAESVVLLIQYEEGKGALGLVINRPSRTPLARVIPEVSGSRNRTEFAFAGGPVEATAARVLVRSRTKPAEGVSVIRGVYMLTNTNPIRDLLADGNNRAEVRAYLGYAGWAPEQLENEVDVGAWHILRADPASIFDPEPAGLWTRLIGETERSIARLLPMRPHP